jgi:hypothetical protein
VLVDTNAAPAGALPLDQIVIGDAANTVQGIQATLTVENSPWYNVVTVNDQGDAAFRTATIDVVNIPAGGPAYERITGLGMPAGVEMDFKCADTRSVTLNTGTAGATVNVLATCVPTTLFGNGALTDTVNVGNAGLTSGIRGDLIVENEPSYTRLVVNDSADPVFRNVTHDVWAPPFDPVPYGRITGLAPAMITYECADTWGVIIATGPGGAFVTVVNTCVPLTLFGFGFANDSVWVQGTSAWGPVTVNASPWETVYICDPNHTLRSIQSPVQVNGDGTTWVSVIDQGNPNPETYTYSDTNLSTSAGPIVNFNSINTLCLYPSFNPFCMFVDNRVVAPYAFVLNYGAPPV